MCKEYNGWDNYQTWNVSLWLDNDYGTYSYIREMAEEYKDKNTWEFANWLKDYVEECNPFADMTSMFTDLLGHAISQVNFDHIAEHIMDEFEDE